MRQHLLPSKQYQLEGVDMSAYIYCITNHITNQCYIGKTELSVEKRFQRHKSNASRGDDTYLYRSMRKYGIDNFSISIIEETSKHLLSEKEIYYIKQISPELNMTTGGDGGSTTHTKMWINNGIINKYILKENNIPEGFVKGRLCKFNDPQFQREMSKRAHNKMTPEDYKNRGKAISESKLGKSHVGAPHTIETKLKLKEIALNRKRFKCIHCDKSLTPAMYNRWHGVNCKYATNSNN